MKRRAFLTPAKKSKANSTCCATGDISVYVPNPAKLWDELRVRHLYNRVGFGADRTLIAQGLAMAPDALIDQIVDTALNTPLPSEPAWVSWTIDEMNTAANCYHNGQLRYDNRRFMAAELLRAIAHDTNRLRYQMVLFWQNHFVTQENIYGDMVFLYKYYRTLLENGMGNFKQFTRVMVTDPAMLIYLNGKDNLVCSPGDIPNENFARELFELFTLGPGNYTDSGTPNDVHETARALTGWRLPTTTLTNGWTHYVTSLPPYLDAGCHDNGVKTIFGVSANFDTDSLIDHLFLQKSDEIATFICTKIYKEFVHATEIDNVIISGLKNTFLTNNFEIAPVVRQLLKSEHFFDECFIGTKVKSPVEFLSGFFVQLETPVSEYYYGESSPLPNTTGSTYGTAGTTIYIGDPLNCPGVNMFEPYGTMNLTYGAFIYNNASENGQTVFDPPNVAGWNGHHTWLSTNQLLGRWDYLADYIYHLIQNNPEELRLFIKDLNNDSINNYEIAETMLNHFIQKPDGFTATEIGAAASVFAGSFPQEEFDLGYWHWYYIDAINQIKSLLEYIVRLPEYQLS